MNMHPRSLRIDKWHRLSELSKLWPLKVISTDEGLYYRFETVLPDKKKIVTEAD